MTLNPDQARVVGATLRLLEKRLGDIEDVLDRPRHGALYRRRAPVFSAERRSRIDALVVELHTAIAAAVQTFGLAAEDQDPIRTVIGTLSVSWESLGEINAARLRGYGGTDPDLHLALDPVVEQLIGLLWALDMAVRRDP